MKSKTKGQSIIVECTKKELRALEIILDKLAKEEQGNPEMIFSSVLCNIRSGLYSNIKFQINNDQD